jgi:hypothetical protein
MTDPYLRAAAKFSAIKAKAVERLGRRPDRPTRPNRPAQPDRPVKPPKGK